MYNMQFSRIHTSQHENGGISWCLLPNCMWQMLLWIQHPPLPLPPPPHCHCTTPVTYTGSCIQPNFYLKGCWSCPPKFFFFNFLFLQVAPHFCRRGFPYEFRGLFGWKPSETSLSRSGSMPIKLGDDGYWVPNLMGRGKVQVHGQGQGQSCYNCSRSH